MLRQGLHSERLGSVVSGVENVDAAFLRLEVGMMRALAGQERIQPLRGSAGDPASASARQDSDARLRNSPLMPTAAVLGGDSRQ